MNETVGMNETHLFCEDICCIYMIKYNIYIQGTRESIS